MKNVGSQRPTNSKEFTENYSSMKKAIEKVDSLAKRLIAGGSENSKARHVKRGKMLPRDRVANLLDIGSFFWKLVSLLLTVNIKMRYLPLVRSRALDSCPSGSV